MAGDRFESYLDCQLSQCTVTKEAQGTGDPVGTNQGSERAASRGEMTTVAENDHSHRLLKVDWNRN